MYVDYVVLYMAPTPGYKTPCVRGGCFIGTKYVDTRAHTSLRVPQERIGSSPLGGGHAPMVFLIVDVPGLSIWLLCIYVSVQILWYSSNGVEVA